MLLFRNTTATEAAYHEMSPEEMQADLENWNKWIGSLAAQGRFVSAEALQQEGKVVSGSKHVVTDGPFVESKELVSGYLILQAASFEEAIELSKACPIYAIEGRVEVRPIMVFNQ